MRSRFGRPAALRQFFGGALRRHPQPQHEPRQLSAPTLKIMSPGTRIHTSIWMMRLLHEIGGARVPVAVLDRAR